MLDLPSIFEAVAENTRADNEPREPTLLGGPTSGQSAVARTVVTGASARLEAQLVRVKSDGAVFEGGLSRSRSGGWNGEEVLGDDWGASKADSSLLSGLVVCADRGESSFAGNRIDDLSEDDSGEWLISEELDELAAELSDESAPLLAMALSGRLTLHADIPNPLAIPFHQTQVLLDGVYSEIKKGDLVIVEISGTGYSAHRVKDVGQTTALAYTGASIEVPVSLLVLWDEGNSA